MLLRPAQARAYVNFGRWVADCPQDCGCALELKPNQHLFMCPECKTMSDVEWPDNPGSIWDALQERPIPKTRNWFPSGHDLALRCGAPHGQTVADLKKETAEHMGG